MKQDLKKILLTIAILLTALGCQKPEQLATDPAPTQKSSQTNQQYIRKNYSSKELGISFDYVYQEGWGNVTVSEKQNRIILSTPLAPLFNYVNVYNKNPNENLEDALQAEFNLKDYPHCTVHIKPSDPNVAALVGRKDNPDESFANQHDCPKDSFGDYVGSSNYIGYFYQDPKSKSKYVFINGSQEATWGEIPKDDKDIPNLKAWYETIKFIE